MMVTTMLRLTTFSCFSGLVGSGIHLMATYHWSFSDKNVGTGKTVTITSIAYSGADG